MKTARLKPNAALTARAIHKHTNRYCAMPLGFNYGIIVRLNRLHRLFAKQIKTPT